jgi:hypothetical protein
MHFLFKHDNLQTCSSSSFNLVLVFLCKVSCFSGYILLQFEDQNVLSIQYSWSVLRVIVAEVIFLRVVPIGSVVGLLC